MKVSSGNKPVQTLTNKIFVAKPNITRMIIYSYFVPIASLHHISNFCSYSLIFLFNGSLAFSRLLSCHLLTLSPSMTITTSNAIHIIILIDFKLLFIYNYTSPQYINQVHLHNVHNQIV